MFAPAFPVRFPPSDSHWWQRAIGAADRGEVLVVDVGEGIDVVPIGDALVEAAMSRKLAGLIINAAVPDSPRLRAAGWPIFARDPSALRTSYRFAAEGELGEPVIIGNILIALGDLVVGDADGVVRMPTNTTGW